MIIALLVIAHMFITLTVMFVVPMHLMPMSLHVAYVRKKVFSHLKKNKKVADRMDNIKLMLPNLFFA